MDTMHVTSSYPVGRTPDVLAFEPEQGRLYVAAEDGVVAIFLEDRFNRGQLLLTTRPQVGPNAHSVAVDPETRHIYVPTVDIRGTPVLRELSVEALPEADD
jgi:DNA-binding beta-propeller fold protein YncE